MVNVPAGVAYPLLDLELTTCGAETGWMAERGVRDRAKARGAVRGRTSLCIFARGRMEEQNNVKTGVEAEVGTRIDDASRKIGFRIVATMLQTLTRAQRR